MTEYVCHMTALASIYSNSICHTYLHNCVVTMYRTYVGLLHCQQRWNYMGGQEWSGYSQGVLLISLMGGVTD